MGKTIDIMQNSLLECKMAGYAPDIMVNIAYDACDFYELGKIATKERLEMHR